jgi:Metallo-peptidase family M12
LRGGSIVLLAISTLGCSESDSQIAPPIDPCSTVTLVVNESGTEQLGSLDDAIAMWSTHGVAGISRQLGGDAAIALQVSAGGSAFFGAYDPEAHTIVINETLTDRTQRAIVIAHELGHAFGLVHVSIDERISVMNPGNLTAAPDPGDAGALAALWGACANP